MSARDPGDFEAYRGRLRHLAERDLPRSLRRRIDPSDVVQDAILRAYRASRCDPTRVGRQSASQRGAWLRRILRNVIVSSLRDHRAHRRDVRREEPLQDWSVPGGSPAGDRRRLADASPSAGLRAREAQAQLRDAIEDLPDEQRDVFRLRRVEGLSIAKIVTRTGKTADAIAGLLRRAQAQVVQRIVDLSRRR